MTGSEQGSVSVGAKQEIECVSSCEKYTVCGGGGCRGLQYLQPISPVLSARRNEFALHTEPRSSPRRPR
jgi:hypothetical protein